MPNDFDTSQYPLGSTHPYVLYNNAGNEDLFVNDVVNETFVDRPPFNRVRKTLHGMTQEFQRLLAASGFEIPAISYAAGVVIDRPSQLISYLGELYSVNANQTFPYTLDGTFATDEPNLVLRSDQALRSDLADTSDFLLGSALIGRNVVAVPSIIGLQDVTPKSDQHYVVRSYHAGYNFGSGVYAWVPSQPKADHDGATIVSPTVPWDGNIATHAAFLAGTGETSPAGLGAYVKMRSGAAVKMSEFGALPGLEHGYIVNAAAALADGGRLVFDIPTGIISVQCTMPDIITLDFTGSKYTFGGDEDFYIYANNTAELHVIRPHFTDPTDFASRTKLHRAIRGEYVELFTVVRPVIDGASTGIHALFGKTFITDHVELRNIKGTAAQYGYGVNTSAENNFIGTINWDNSASPGHGRHALYVNGRASNTHVKLLKVDTCVYNPVNTAIDEDVVGVFDLDYCDFTDCNTVPLSNRVGCVHLTAQGAGTFGPNGMVFTSRVIKSVGSAGGLFSIGQYGYHGSRVGKLIGRSPLNSTTSGVAIAHTRFANNVWIDEIDIDVMPTTSGTAYVLEYRDSANVGFGKITVGGSVGAAAAHFFEVTNGTAGDIFSSIPKVLVSGTTTWSRAALDSTFYLIGGGTPSTGGKKNLYTTATGLSITMLLDGNDGDVVNIVSMGGSTTIVHNPAFILTKTGADVVLGEKKTIQLIKRGSVWLEV